MEVESRIMVDTTNEESYVVSAAFGIEVLYP